MEDKQTNVLDHGFVRLVDVMGDDRRIVDAARVSYANAPTPASRTDAKLIDYLMEHAHTSPFEQVVFTFHCKMPIFVARQWVRHRTARLNEISGRYSVMKNEFYVPDVEQIRLQSTTNKQGRSDEIAQNASVLQACMRQSYSEAYMCYTVLVESGVSREVARMVLPLAIYTEWYWQMDLHNLFHFLKLRLDSHAQYEIRVYAEAIADMVKECVPLAWESFERHVLNACTLSADDVPIVREALRESIYGVDDPGAAEALGNVLGSLPQA